MVQTVRSMLRGKGHEVWSIGPSSTVYEAIRLMSDKGVGALVVLDGQRLVGIISERDYTRNVILKERASRSTNVAEIMSRKVYYVDPERTAEECMALMTERRVRHLPVLDQQAVVGVISIGDVVKAVIHAKGLLIEQLERYIIGG
ncbi:MAG: CBS domain-containing protein [Proteobacteria bacterium]|nr:CBS domain-containing protein [Pseudomonadota bacterium]